MARYNPRRSYMTVLPDDAFDHTDAAMANPKRRFGYLVPDDEEEMTPEDKKRMEEIARSIYKGTGIPVNPQLEDDDED